MPEDHQERLLQGSAFPDDDGRGDRDLVEALAAAAAVGDLDSRATVLGLLGEARLLVPVVAVLGEVEYGDEGLTRDKSSEMATVLLTGRDGRVALLGFTSSQTMAAWDSQARPVPVSGQIAARSALAEQAQALLIDVAGPHPFVVEGEDLGAISAGWELGRAGGAIGWIGCRPE